MKGEDSLLGAIREAKEEVGVDLNLENGQVLFTKTRKIIEGKIFNDILDVWLFEYDGEVDLSNATTDEVAQVAWMDRSQIKELFVAVGSWIEGKIHNEVVLDPEFVRELIIDEFNLPDDVEFKVDEHWNIGHGWSEDKF